MDRFIFNLVEPSNPRRKLLERKKRDGTSHPFWHLRDFKVFLSKISTSLISAKKPSERIKVTSIENNFHQETLSVGTFPNLEPKQISQG